MQEARERALADPLRDEVERAGPKIFFTLILTWLERKKLEIPELEKLES